MSIATNSIITWSDFTTQVLNAIKSACCNIDSVSSSVPSQLKASSSGTTVRTDVKTISTSQPSSGYNGGYVATTWKYSANSSNHIVAVPSSTVNSEWSTFLSAAGINARSNKIIQAYDLTMAMGLCQQFMSFHIKPMCCRLNIYNDNSTVFRGAKYITGTCTPKYTLTAVEPNNIPEITNADINGRYKIIRESIFHDNSNYGIIDAENNPVLFKSYLSGAKV